MHARARALAGRVQAGHARSAVEVGDDAADRVVRGGGDGDRLAGRVVARTRERRHQRRIPVALDAAEIERRAVARGDRARDHVPRRELVGEALAVLVQEGGACAAQRFGEEEAVVEQRGGMELDELEVGERRARAVREQQPFAGRAARVRRPLPQGGIAAGGEDDRLPGERGDGVDAFVGDDADARVLLHARSEHLSDTAAGLGAARVHDAAAGMAALAGETLVELHAEVDELGDAFRRVSGEELDRALAAEPAAGGERVSGVQRRVVVGTDRCGHAALRGPAVGGVDRALCEDEDRCARVGGGQRSGEAGDSGTDDREVGMQFLPQRR